MVVAEYQVRQRWTEADARAALAAWAGTGMSLAEFAHLKGLEAQRLYRWQRRLGGEPVGPQAAPGFIEVCAHGSVTSTGTFEVVLRSGRVLRAAETITPSVLERLVTALER